MERYKYTQFTTEEIDEIVKNTKTYKHGGLGENRPPFSQVLIGQKLTLRYDNGVVLKYNFINLHSLIWQEDGNGEHTEYYEALDVDDGITQVLHTRYGTVPQEAIIIVFDFNEGIITTFFSKIGNEFSPREVHRDIVFGYIDRKGEKPPEKRHSMTKDLIGKSIIWTYGEKFTIQHMYSSEWYSTFVDYNSFIGGLMLTSPCNYVKINDHVYIYSWVEIEAAGLQGFALMNLYEMHDVGCFFGINGNDKFECYTFGAEGKYAGQLTNFDIYDNWE